jgi:hypothetical protein
MSLAACSSSPAGAGPAPAAGGAASSLSAASSPARPGLTLGDAQSVFGSYVAVSNRAARTGDRALALSMLSEVAWETVKAQFTIAAAAQARPPYTQYAYGTPTFYLVAPAAGAHHEYFVVSVERTPVPGARAMTPLSQDVTAGVRLPGAGRVLMLFARPVRAGHWQLVSQSQLAPGQSVPPLATDGHGYVRTASFDAAAGTPLVRPALAPPLAATVVDDGPASPASQVVAGGPLTTGLYQAAASSARGISAPPGDIYQWLLEGSSYGRLALATTDGGALILYAMYLDSTVATRSSINQDVPVLAGPQITVPGYVRPLLPAARLAPRKKLETQDILSFAAIDPPAAQRGEAAKIQVIAIGGGFRMAMSQ